VEQELVAVEQELVAVEQELVALKECIPIQVPFAFRRHSKNVSCTIRHSH
jgi:hypothetical protein